MPLFDAYFFIDWSASNKPSPRKPARDAIWLGELVRGAPPMERYHRTRASCLDDLRSRLRTLTAGGSRVLVGCDFAYGYPRGLAGALGLTSGRTAWERTWNLLASMVTDNDHNANNRWSVASALNGALMDPASPIGPFWGCPAAAATATLRPSKHEGNLSFPFVTRSGTALPEWRHADNRARAASPTVQSAWKLFTAGSVGSQALLGIPWIAKLRQDKDLAAFSRVWPFETGFSGCPGPGSRPFILHAEVWPVLRRDEVQAALACHPGLVLDQAQVRILGAWAAQTDAHGRLGSFFDTPAGLSEQQADDCLEEEGWILGLP